MAKPIAIISNDWHLNESNLDDVLGLIVQKINLAKSLHVNILIGLGDLLQERKSQKEIVLNTLSKILDLIEEAGMTLIAIPGNHDKTDYASTESFLTPFVTHPAFDLITIADVRRISSIKCCFIPFFSESVWVENFSKIKEPYDILFSHTAVNGSINNNNTKVETTITPALFKGIKQVFLGHYHNVHEPAPNIIHLPSIQQNNFGENDFKGFTVLNDDLSFEIKPSIFKKYINLKINGLKLTSQKIQEIIRYFNTNDIYLRVIVEGDSNIIKALNLEELKRNGIKVFPMITDFIVSNGQSKNVDYSEKETLIEVFKVFCIEKNIDFETGIDYIKNLK